ncbi:hypothetical protein BKA93DRAFT_222147 [Sparassis latifolia]
MRASKLEQFRYGASAVRASSRVFGLISGGLARLAGDQMVCPRGLSWGWGLRGRRRGSCIRRSGRVARGYRIDVVRQQNSGCQCSVGERIGGDDDDRRPGRPLVKVLTEIGDEGSRMCYVPDRPLHTAYRPLRTAQVSASREPRVDIQIVEETRQRRLGRAAALLQAVILFRRLHEQVDRSIART